MKFCNKFPGGVWPVMLTPFTKDNEVDYPSLAELVKWYISKGIDGLFAVCQSSEMKELSLAERIKIAQFVVEKAEGRVPVIASGHISTTLEEQAQEINAISATGIDAFILVTNRMATKDENDDIWITNLQKLLSMIDDKIPLGFYECPFPYKRVMSEKVTRWCAESGRFYFIKDTSCDINNIRMKLEICRDTNIKIYNANTTTLLDSLKLGAAGYSGVMANMHPELYSWLCKYPRESSAEKLSDELTVLSFIEKQLYPVNAKYFLQLEGISINLDCRTKDLMCFSETFAKEVQMIHRITKRLDSEFL